MSVWFFTVLPMLRLLCHKQLLQLRLFRGSNCCGSAVVIALPLDRSGLDESEAIDLHRKLSFERSAFEGPVRGLPRLQKLQGAHHLPSPPQLPRLKTPPSSFWTWRRQAAMWPTSLRTVGKCGYISVDCWRAQLRLPMSQVLLSSK